MNRCDECNCYKKIPKSAPVCVATGKIFNKTDMKYMQVDQNPLWCPLEDERLEDERQG